MSVRYSARYLLISLLLFAKVISAQTTPTPPGLEFVCELNVTIDPALVVGETMHGTRRIIPITGGTFSGPKLKGTIVNGGADWQVVHPNGVTELNALYTLKTDDGTLIYINNRGLRSATPDVVRRINSGETVSPDDYYFRAAPTFEAPPGKYEWLNRVLFISKAIRAPKSVTIQVWQIL